MGVNFQPVTDFLNQVEQQYGVPSCECVVFQNHKLLYHHWAGHLDWDKQIPLQGGEWYWIYSCTKLMTMTAALQLWEQGRLGLDDPVSKYLPEYNRLTVRAGETVRPARTELTVRHLMTMTGGLNYNLNCPAILNTCSATDHRASTREIIRALAAEPLDFDPGTHFQYSLCHDVVGAVVEAVSGERLSDYIQNHIAGPLGITGITFRPGERELAHMPGQLCYHDQKQIIFRAGKVNTYQLSANYDSGGAGICCRAEDYILFADALACGGVGKTGARILRPETIALMSANQLQGTCFADYHNTMKPESEGYGLGMRVRLTDDGIVPPGEFGWDGAGGATANIEPKSHLSVFYTQHLLNYLPNYAELHPELLRRIYQAVLPKG
ncbi:MAG: serine hydrolase domain-containing protein [Candidatus Onthomonas sp.]